MTPKIKGPRPLIPIEGMSVDEKRRLVDRLAAVMLRVITDVAALGRIDLVAPLHDAYLMLARRARAFQLSGFRRTCGGGSSSHTVGAPRHSICAIAVDRALTKTLAPGENPAITTIR